MFKLLYLSLANPAAAKPVPDSKAFMYLCSSFIALRLRVLLTSEPDRTELKRGFIEGFSVAANQKVGVSNRPSVNRNCVAMPATF